MRKTLSIALWCATLAAQGLDGPSLGLELDSHARVVRPIRGVVGAALLGDATELTLEHASVSATLAAGLDSAKGIAVVQNLLTGRRLALPEAPAEWQSILFSPSETVLAIAGNGRVALYRGLSSEISRAEITVPDGAALLAVSDDGAILGNAGDGVWRWSAEGASRVAEGQASAAAFEARSGRAAFAIGNSISILDSNLQPVQSAEANGVSALAFSTKGRLVATSAATRRAYVLQNSAITALDCDFEPNLLRALASSEVFQISDTAGIPVWLLDVSSEARIAFVPKSTEAANE